MNSLGRTLLIILFLAAVMLASCSSRQSTPTVSDAEIMETAISTVSTDFAETQRAIPTNMPLPTVIPTRTPTSPPKPSPTSTSVFTDPSIPLSERIVYYYLVGQRENPIPEGAVRAVSFNAGAVFHVAGLVAPTYADETYTSDTAADLRTALEIVLHDERNSWGGPDFEPEIVDVTFRFGHAKVRLQNEYSIGEPSSSRDVYAPVVGTRMLILLTVFANPAVQTATVWFNEDTIANLAIYDSRQAKPADYVFTRAEMETYLKEQEYVTPTPIPTSTPIMFIDPSLPLPETLPNAIDLQWITAYGLPGDQIATKIHPTKDGGFILVGNTVVGQLRGPSWLLKLRADGFIEWQKSLPQVRALDVLETSAGDFILAGDLHWIKLDSQGNILWQYTFGGFSYHTPPILRLVEESNGNIVVEAVGSRTVFNAEGELQSFTEYAMNWDSQTYPANIRDRSGETLWAGGEKNSLRYWVGKADLNDGWLKGLSSSEYDIGPMLFIQTTADGGVIVGVPGYENVDPIGYFSYVLISLFSGDGSVRWQKIYHSDSVASHEDFHAFETKSGDFIVAGTFVDFQGGGDVWISRLDRDGNIRWMKLYRTEGKDAVAFIQELSNGDLIFAGRTSGAGTGAQDMWILKTKAQGEIPNCGHARNIRASWSRARAVSSEVETIALGGISLIEREVIPIFEDEPRPFGDADARVIPLCLPSP